MTDENYSRLKEKIASLPSGGITYKKIMVKNMHITSGVKMADSAQGV